MQTFRYNGVVWVRTFLSFDRWCIAVTFAIIISHFLKLYMMS